MGEVVVPPPVVPPPVVPPMVYASFGRRLVASLLDGIIVGIAITIISLIMGVITGIVLVMLGGSSKDLGVSITSVLVQIVNIILTSGYYIYFTAKEGQTLGKKALEIKVVKKDSQQAPGYMSAFLREVVGKFVSGIVFGLGYLWMLWDKDKQTWHDKIAGTIVIKV